MTKEDEIKDIAFKIMNNSIIDGTKLLITAIIEHQYNLGWYNDINKEELLTNMLKGIK